MAAEEHKENVSSASNNSVEITKTDDSVKKSEVEVVAETVETDVAKPDRPCSLQVYNWECLSIS